ASPVWIAKLSDSSIEQLPRTDSNDFNPMWLGTKIYFLSDRNGPVTLFAYDTQSKQVRPVLPNKGLDLKSASASGDVIVYEQFGTLFLFDVQTEKSRKLEVRIRADLPTLRPRFVKVAKQIQNVALSPTGARVAFEARGEILTVPAQKGDFRNLTNTPGVCERSPAWSPDGQRVAYFSDASGEYALHIRNQSGQGEVKKIPLGKNPSFYYAPVWPPDGKKIAYPDKRLQLWFVDLEKNEGTLVDTDTYDSPSRSLDPAWSPDSLSIAYTKRLPNHLHAVFVHSLQTNQSHQITDGRSDARYPVFDPSGKYLYFTASTDTGLTSGWLDMSSMNRPISRSVYLVVLDKTQPSPLAPESDEEKVPPPADKKPEEKKTEPVRVRIDVERIDQRLLALPLPARDIQGLLIGKSGTLFVLDRPYASGLGGRGQPPRLTLAKFELDKRKEEKYLEGASRIALSS